MVRLGQFFDVMLLISYPTYPDFQRPISLNITETSNRRKVGVLNMFPVQKNESKSPTPNPTAFQGSTGYDYVLLICKLPTGFPFASQCLLPHLLPGSCSQPVHRQQTSTNSCTLQSLCRNMSFKIILDSSIFQKGDFTGPHSANGKWYFRHQQKLLLTVLGRETS